MDIEHLCDDLKSIESVTIASGVNLGVQDAETGLVEITANTRKQIGLVWCVDHHLQAFTQR